MFSPEHQQQEENLIKPNKNLYQIKQGDKNWDIVVIWLQFINRFKIKNEKMITQFQIADATGSIQCNFFDEIGTQWKEGDILFIKGGYATVFKGHLVWYTPKIGFGQIMKIGEFFMTYEDKPNLSEKYYQEDNEDHGYERKLKINK